MTINRSTWRSMKLVAVTIAKLLKIHQLFQQRTPGIGDLPWCTVRCKSLSSCGRFHCKSTQPRHDLKRPDNIRLLKEPNKNQEIYSFKDFLANRPCTSPVSPTRILQMRCKRQHPLQALDNFFLISDNVHCCFSRSLEAEAYSLTTASNAGPSWRYSSSWRWVLEDSRSRTRIIVVISDLGVEQLVRAPKIKSDRITG